MSSRGARTGRPQVGQLNELLPAWDEAKPLALVNPRSKNAVIHVSGNVSIAVANPALAGLLDLGDGDGRHQHRYQQVMEFLRSRADLVMNCRHRVERVQDIEDRTLYW